MEKSKRFQDVEVWKQAHQWVLDIYKTTESFPKSELFGLTSQLRRSAVSIPANFAEGFRKKSLSDKLRYYNIAQGSISESMYHLILAKDLGYADTSMLMQKLTKIDVMLQAYMKAIEKVRKDR
jgi:four helix bundle protein